MSMLKRFVACAAIVAGVAGCAGQGATTPKISGAQLTVYVSAPTATASAQDADVVAAEQLAFQRQSHTLSHFTVRLRVLHASASDNARTAIQDSSAIAYIGELVPGSSGGTIGITNAQDLLQVSPTDTALELTRSTPVVPGAPNTYYQSLSSNGRTFARVVPTSGAEARVQAGELHALRVHKVYVANDGSPYGKAIAHALQQDVGPPITAVEGPANGSRASAAGADAVFFGGSSTSSAASFFNSVASSAPHAKLLAPSALYDQSFVQGLSSAARGQLYVSSPGFARRDEPAAARSEFVAPFVAAYHHQPAPQAHVRSNTLQPYRSEQQTE
jgi:ABC-type branched-subunit amino acid transport system substrate-binding protein